MIKPWTQIGSKKIGDFRIFQLRSDLKISPRTGQEHDFFILECVDWVNVIAVTPQDELVMVEQYRHGSNTVELEIPGGMMDPQESSPLEAGLRELREETGYEGSNARILGKIFANPAILTNTCHTILVQDCELKHDTAWDHGEDLITRLVPFREIPDLITSGRIGHSLVVVALFHYDLWRRKHQTGCS
ncbi:MAG: NUDIX hydrolase [Verrucomicrobiota bacterium]|jgi:ADP-ribose pyrophosphatase